jgi:vacuolar-type H+-ATPase subunit I/STV1
MPLASPSTTHHGAHSPANRTGLAVAALVIGVLTVGIALMVAFVGVFLPYAWFAVIVLAVLTLLCGLLSVGHKHHSSAAGETAAWIGVVGGVVALVVGVWGTTDVLRGAHHTGTAASPVRVLPVSPDRTAPPPVAPTTPLGGPIVAVGQNYQLDNVTVRLTGPDQYTPSGMAAVSDGSEIRHAVEFTATITNNTSAALLASGVGIEGIVGGATVGHIYDQTINGLTQDIQPGQTVSYPVAFNVPPTSTPMLIQVSPQSQSSTDKVFYQATV